LPGTQPWQNAWHLGYDNAGPQQPEKTGAEATNPRIGFLVGGSLKGAKRRQQEHDHNIQVQAAEEE
jgi:hypothetical protein